MSKINAVGIFLISPSLDRVLVSMSEETSSIPWCRIGPRENPIDVIQKILFRNGLTFKKEDLIKEDPIIDNDGTAYFMAYSSAKPAGRISFVPWRILENECDSSFLNVIEKIKKEIL